MRELKIITVPFDPRLRIFDDEALCSYLKGREVLRAEPELITHEGTALWTIYLEPRRLLGAERPSAAGRARPDARAEAGTGQPPSRRDGEERQVAERAAFRRLLGDLDEIERVRYDALLEWRRRTAGDEGIPPYVILTNRQCLDIARAAPRTLEGLRQIKGVGNKRLKKHGRLILEVLHGRTEESQPEPAPGAAVGRARKMARRHRYFLKMDVHHYFESIDHAVLMRLLGEQIRDPDVLWLCQALLEGARRPEHGEGRPRGLPIGNLTSQFWANVYLHPVDDLVSRRMGRGTYLRYMDDMLVFGPSKAGLWEVAEEVSTMLTEELRLRLKRRATVLAPVTEGIGWLGFRVHPGTTRLDREGRRRFTRKVRRLGRRAARSPLAEDRLVPVAASVCGHLAQADTHGLRRSVLDDRERG